MRQGILQEQPRIIVPPEISTAEYLEASDHAKLIAENQGREDVQEILQTILRIRAQGKRELRKLQQNKQLPKAHHKEELNHLDDHQIGPQAEEELEVMGWGWR